MKNVGAVLAGVWVFANVVHAADLVQLEPYDQRPSRGLHHQWIRPENNRTNEAASQIGTNLLSSTNLSGQWLITTNTGFVHLEAGLHYQDEEGNLQKAEAVIESFPEGAIASKTAIKVIFSPDINAAGAIDILTPENVRLRGTPLGLSYYDAASGKSVMIAEVKSASAEIVAPNKLVYKDFLDDVLADAVYEIRKSGLMQMIVIREDLPPPSAYGLSDETSRLELLTEFLGAPEPEQIVRVINSEQDALKRLAMAEPDFKDETLKFGNAIMPPGVAFGLNMAEREADPVRKQPVGKHWEDIPIEGRSVLFESVEYLPVREHLRGLPRAELDGEEKRAALKREIPAKRIALAAKAPVEIARAEYRPKGFAIDFEVYQGLSQMTFYSGVTYVVTNVVWSGDVTFQPGCIIKFASGGSLGITTTVNCNGTASNPSVFTAYDDDSYGEILPAIGGFPASNGHPSGYYASRAIDISSYYASTFRHMKIRHATVGIYLNSNPYAGGPHQVLDSIFESCQTGVVINNNSPTLSNLKMCSVPNHYTTIGSGSPTTSGITTDCTGGYTEIAKLSTTPDASSYWRYSDYSSLGVDWDGSRVIDGYMSEPVWHSAPEYYPASGQWVRLNLNSSRQIGKVAYYPRPGPYNGTFVQYKVFVTSSSSTDPGSWGTPVAQGTWNWSYGNEIKVLEFAPVQGQFVVFQCVEGMTGWAAAGEVWVYESGTPPSNLPPTVSLIPNQTLNLNTDTGPLSFTVNDSQTAAGSLTVSAGSSNEGVVPNGLYHFGRERRQPDGDGDAGFRRFGDGDYHGICQRWGLYGGPAVHRECDAKTADAYTDPRV